MKQFGLIMLLVVALAFSAFAPLAMAFDPLGQACNSGSSANGSAVCKDRNSSPDNPVTSVIGTAVQILTILIGVAAVIMIIVSGAQMIASAGNAETVKKARGRLTAAIVGVVIAALAWTLTTYILNHIT